MKIKYIALFILIFASLCANAQQDAQYTQYMYNTISVNPAYAGSKGMFSGILLYRTQWVGLEGAPKTKTLGLHTPIDSKGKIGLGLSILQDEIGPSDQTYIDIDFSYTINISYEGKLSFGLKAGGSFLNIDFNKITAFDLNDNLLQTNIDKKFSPNVGLGLYYHTDKFYMGLSVPNMLETEHFDEYANSNNSTSYIASDRMHYYIIGGYVFDLSENVKFKPAFLTKAVTGSPLQVDLSATALINNKFSIGAAYRWSAALSGLLGFQISDKLMLGYAYDGDTTKLQNFNSGSHEIFLRFELFSNKGGIINPRFF